MKSILMETYKIIGENAVAAEKFSVTPVSYTHLTLPTKLEV